MSLVLSLLTLGILPAVWLSGYVLLAWASRNGRLPITQMTAWSLAPAISLPVWSLAMAFSAYWGIFHAPTWGAVGWIACILLLPLALTRRELGHQQGLTKRLALVVLLAGSFALYAAFPHDAFFVGRDQATYSNQALHVARSGALALDWPLSIEDPELRAAIGRSSYHATGIYLGPDRLTVQFSPILPIWLAIAFAAAGIVGLQGFNAVVAALSVPVFFGVAARLMSRRVALAATALFALNPMQIWISRIALSEILAQYLVLSGVLLTLLAGRREPERHWIVGGLTLGASVLVRIDGFVLAPLAVAFAWVMRSVNQGEPSHRDRARRLGVWALLFILALGVPFYLLTSTEYFSAQAKNLVPLAACSAILLVLWRMRWGTRWMGFVVRRPAFWSGLAVALGLLGIFAYFIRPRWEPFSTYGNPSFVLFGSRDFREASFVNLAVYLTPVTAFAALGGFWSMLRRALARPSRDALTFLLILIGGYAVLYLLKPSISPDHPWGMRRFVPIIIPGFVLLASSLLDRARTLRWLRRGHLPVTLLITAALLAYSNFRMRAGLFLREYSGAYSFVSSIANAIPDGALLLCDASPRVFGHLALGRGLKTIRFSLKNPERFDAAQAAVSSILTSGEPYYVLTDDPQLLSGEKPIQAFKERFDWLEETTTPPATRVRKASFNYYLFKRSGPLEEPWKYLADLGFSPIDGVREGGFWPIERDAGEPTRWTTHEAWLDIPIKDGWSPRTLELVIVGLPPTGTWLTVRANDADIYNARIDNAPVSLSLSLPKRLRKRFRLELVTDTFRPSDGDGSGDNRELGIRIKRISVR